MAHKGKIGPYLFERDLSLDFNPPYNLYDRYRIVSNQMKDGTLDAVLAPERFSEGGVASYTTGEIIWTWSWVNSLGGVYGCELRYKLTFDADMRIFATRCRVGAVWTSWHDETNRPSNASALNLGNPWIETILVGSFFHTVTFFPSSIGCKPW